MITRKAIERLLRLGVNIEDLRWADRSPAQPFTMFGKGAAYDARSDVKYLEILLRGFCCYLKSPEYSPELVPGEYFCGYRVYMKDLDHCYRVPMRINMEELCYDLVEQVLMFDGGLRSPVFC